mmetsp:Transcript_8415/g.25285  ORF Transcript_8415/g.25285 Transcript_8415/m.25285 type:complete len:214 (+) Transcript_8415:2-643(+)
MDRLVRLQPRLRARDLAARHGARGGEGGGHDDALGRVGRPDELTDLEPPPHEQHPGHLGDVQRHIGRAGVHHRGLLDGRAVGRGRHRRRRRLLLHRGLAPAREARGRRRGECDARALLRRLVGPLGARVLRAAREPAPRVRHLLAGGPLLRRGPLHARVPSPRPRLHHHLGRGTDAPVLPRSTGRGPLSRVGRDRGTRLGQGEARRVRVPKRP